jgi:hypothetical protein
MWEPNDNRSYNQSTSQNVGQISNDKFSEDITKYASNVNNKSFLEIGTWNGLGSTRVFVDALKNRTDNYIFYSLECNKDKSTQASKLYTQYDKVNILNEVIWNEEPSDFYDIFPQCKTNKLYKSWNDVDIINMKRCSLFLNRENLPKIFDVILLDGGEFTTYYEFKILKDRCKILLLDDINTDKCKFIVNEIENNSDKWTIIKKELNIRNGYLIAEAK